MKKTITLSLFLLVASAGVFAQSLVSGFKIKDDVSVANLTSKHGKVSAPKSCGSDTILYGRYKGDTLRAINISQGYRLGQYYESPDSITISGFDFYGWVTTPNVKKVTVYCHIYKPGPDSLPTGSPIRSDTIVVTDNFGGGTLTGLKKRATFQPYKTNEAYVLVVESNDTARVGIVVNDYVWGDGQAENLGLGTVGGRWYHGLDLNIGGITLDCDVILEPYVQYDIHNDFSFDNCFKSGDTIEFTNKSSKFYSSRVYNVYTYSGIEYYCHRWSFSTIGGYVRAIDYTRIFPTEANNEVMLISTIYQSYNFSQCIDTTIKTLNYQPSDVKFGGDKTICSGNFGTMTGSSSGQIYWYNTPSDTGTIFIGNTYVSDSALQETSTKYAEAHNGECKSKRVKNKIDVIETPKITGVEHDSVCLNSMANLIAHTSAGTVRWYADSTTLNPVGSGEVFQIGPLDSDTFLYAQAVNGQCSENERFKVLAYVNAAFAPADPTVGNDTAICLLDGSITLVANGNQTLRWFDVAAGGSPIDTGTSTIFKPKKRGTFYKYVESFDGKCASSRLPIKVVVSHFDVLQGLANQSACAGDSVGIDYASIFGGMDWFKTPTGGNSVFSGKSRAFYNISKNDTFYLETSENGCKDTQRYKWSYEAIPFGKIISKQLDNQQCDGITPTLMVNADLGEVVWYDADGKNELYRGNNFVTKPIKESTSFWYNIDNRGCKTPLQQHNITWRIMPDANFDYQVAWRDVILASRFINQGDYIWNFDDGTDTSMGTDVTHHYYVDGDYNVSLIVASPYNCIDTVTKTITINSVGVKDISADFYFDIAPNPNNGHFWILLKNDFLADEVLVYDITGTLVYQKTNNLDGSKIAISLPQLSKGVYFIQAYNKEIAVSKRFIVE
ncbi:MAG: T9SS type A sorting domain-containing protein [Flavobacteriales bacterium]|nr:T9SS type A sorting domain-containing protein [Flavobacteriales bacterium]